MPYTSQNVVVSIFLTLVSYLLPVCCVAGSMKKSHSKKWVFGVVIACILPASLLWAVLHFASGASHNAYPALIWGCIAFAMLSARSDVIKKREYDEASQSPEAETIEQKKDTDPVPMSNDNSAPLMDKQTQEQNKIEQPTQETQVVSYVDAYEPTSKLQFNCTVKDNASDNTAAPTQRATFCRYCGTKYGKDDTTCPGCGKRVRISFKSKNSKTSLFISLAANAVLIVFFVLFVSAYESEYSSLQAKYDSLETKYDSLSTRYNNISKAAAQRLETITELKPYKEKADFLDAHIAFVVSDDAYAYHTYDCHFFQNCDSFWAYNIEAARSKGYSPCKVCH